ncbi:calcium-binding protein, partial [Nitrosomonas ureae]
MTTKTINGTGGNDAISIADNGAGFDVTLNVNTIGPFVDDTIIVNGGFGNDDIDLSALTSASGVTNVTINGGVGNDNLTGSQINNTFLVSGGGEGSDTYQGGADNDTIKAQSNNTTIGLAGNFNASNSVETITADGKTGVTVAGDGSGNILDFTGTALTDVLIDGGFGNDTITGNDDANTIRGGVGNDTINGAGGEDTFLVSG